MSVGHKLSRRKLAGFLAEQLQSGKSKQAIQQVAAYLIEMKKIDSIGLLVRDVEEILADSGTVVADTTSARALSEEDKNMIAKLFGAKKLYTRETIDPSVLGGVLIEASGRRLDATLKHRIDLLKEMDSRKGTKWRISQLQN